MPRLRFLQPRDRKRKTEGAPMPEPSKKAQEVERLARERRTSLIGEFWLFLKHNKKWWLLPILLVLLVMGALVMIGGSGMAPWIYTLF